MKNVSHVSRNARLVILGTFMAGFFAIVPSCGGGGNGGGDDPSGSTVKFVIPDYYEDVVKKSGNYNIIAGKNVKLYALTKDNFDKLSDVTAKIDADYLGSGTTGSGTVRIDLTDSVNNQQRYVIGIISDSPDFQLGTMEDIQNAVLGGTVLYGQTKDSDGNSQMVSLTDGAVVNGLSFVGGQGSSKTCVIRFTMPSDYYGDFDSTSPIAAIPSDKAVKFYTIDSTDEPLATDTVVYKGTTVTGGGSMSFSMSNDLNGKTKYIYAIVVLKGNFDLAGATKSSLIAALNGGDVLFGKFAGTSGVDTVTLTDDNTIDGVKFIGK